MNSRAEEVAQKLIGEQPLCVNCKFFYEDNHRQGWCARYPEHRLIPSKKLKHRGAPVWCGEHVFCPGGSSNR